MSELAELDQIRQRIAARFQKNPGIVINVTLKRPKLSLRNVPVTIVGVYPHLFLVEEADGKKRHTLQYTDILLHHVEILDF